MRLAPSLAAAVIVLAGSQAPAQTIVDPSLTVETVVTGLDYPTTMAFIGNDDILVLQKNDGRVRRVTSGVLQPGEVLDVAVSNDTDKGLLGIALDPDFINDHWVFLYYSEAPSDGAIAIANRVYRYTWDGSSLVDPHLVLEFPNNNSHDVGGILKFGPDDKLYSIMGDLERIGKLQNRSTGADPDDTSVIVRTNADGSVPPDNPFADASGTLAPMKRYFAYGVRNSFGLTFDPVTGALWDTENGLGAYDEINRVDSGLNSGWLKIQGPDSRSPQNQSDLWFVPGSHYADPAFSWYLPVSPTAIHFIRNPKLGCGRVHDVLVGDTNCGNLSQFVPNAARNGFVFTSPELQDQVADNGNDVCTEEQSETLFGSGFGFGVLTDIETGPDGNVYVIELASGTIYRIVPSLSAAVDADGDGVADSCDCNAADSGSWSATVEVPRVRVSGSSATTLGWDTQRDSAGPGARYSVVSGTISSLRATGSYGGACTLAASLASPRADDTRAAPAPGEAYFYLVRAGNGCGSGSFGDASPIPDPRDAIDASLPTSCPGR